MASGDGAAKTELGTSAPSQEPSMAAASTTKTVTTQDLPPSPPLSGSKGTAEPATMSSVTQSTPVPQSIASSSSPPSHADPATASTNSPAPNATPTIPPSDSQTLQAEQEDFEGTVDVTDDLPTEKDLAKVEDMLLLDDTGQSRPFKDLYRAEGVAPRQLVIFIRHFFCGNCQDYIRTLSRLITPSALLSLPTPTFITIIGCGRPELIPMYTAATSCPFPIYAEPTRKLYDHLGMTRTYNLGSKPKYIQSSLLTNSVASILQGLGQGKKALKGGDFKQVGGEFLFEEGKCVWAHRMRTTRGHTEIGDLKKLVGLEAEGAGVRVKGPAAVVRGKKEDVLGASGRRSLSWGRLRSKSRGKEEVEGVGKKSTERGEEERKLAAQPTV